MNQELLTRLFKSIEGPKDNSLVRIAYSIIEDEKKKGHNLLARKLEKILDKNINSSIPSQRILKVVKDGGYYIPKDRRYNLPLATHIPREKLRHEMVLSPEMEQKVSQIEQEYAARDRLALFGLHPRRKILLFGPSGCGKSMTAERVAWNLGLPFFKVRFDTIISSYLGESASNLNLLFKSLNEVPCVLLLDEFDIVAKKRGQNRNDIGEIDRIVNILLGLLEEFESDGLLFATTNLEGQLDNALFRRFDDMIEVGMPDENEINALLSMTLESMVLSEDVDIIKLSKLLNGKSSAQVVRMAQNAAKKSVIEGGKKVNMAHFEQAISESNSIS